MLEKINTPIAIIVGSIVLAISFYFVQVDKRESIERQQRIEDGRKAGEAMVATAEAELKLKQAECISLTSGLKAQWNNVIGVTYEDGFYDECMVTYKDTETGAIQRSPLSRMKDTE